ncbi:glycosyltransferase [Hyphomonas sp.]|jgi:SAM-dependent methyltransferase|uniref:glycosyltransferase n=1 Tax=Hyphomonas sp. TaxID=87 RepID=UPI0037C09BD9
MSVPKLFHFITGLAPDFGGKPFSFIHHMAVRSALLANPGFKARMYFEHEPQGLYWEHTKPLVEVVRVKAPKEIFGKRLKSFAHQSDVLRLEILMREGGIYLDLDTITLRSFDPLMSDRLVMGQELGPDQKYIGLCNATMITPPGSRFIEAWYRHYENFSDELWNTFSVVLPSRLSRQMPEHIKIEPVTAFFWPSWDEEGIKSLFLESKDFSKGYSIHLWESRSWKYVRNLTAHEVLQRNTSYNLIARRYLGAHAAKLIEAEGQILRERALARAAAAAETNLMANDDAKAPDAGQATMRQGAEHAQEAHRAALPKLTDRFSEIYDKNVWGIGSGVGSRPGNNIDYMQFIQEFMLRNEIRSVVDLGCGDWQFSRHMNWDGVTYVGFDVVNSVIEANTRLFARENIRFSLFESLNDLPQADLLLCKDVLQHLPNDLIRQYLAFFKKKFKAMLITNDDYPEQNINRDIQIGGWRCLRLEREPFLERASVVKSWVVLDGPRTTRKATYLLYGGEP